MAFFTFTTENVMIIADSLIHNSFFQVAKRIIIDTFSFIFHPVIW